MEQPLCLGPRRAPRLAPSLASPISACFASLPRDRMRARLRWRIEEYVVKECRRRGRQLTPGELGEIDVAVGNLFKGPGTPSESAVQALAARYSSHIAPLRYGGAAEELLEGAPRLERSLAELPEPQPPELAAVPVQKLLRFTASPPAAGLTRPPIPRPFSAPPRPRDGPRSAFGRSPFRTPWATDPPRPGSAGATPAPAPAPAPADADQQQPAADTSTPPGTPAEGNSASEAPEARCETLDMSSVAEESMRRQRSLGIPYQMTAPAKRERRLVSDLLWSRAADADRELAAREALELKQRVRRKRKAQLLDLDCQMESQRRAREREAEERRAMAREAAEAAERYKEEQLQLKRKKRERALAERAAQEQQLAANRRRRAKLSQEEAEADAEHVRRAKEELAAEQEWQLARRERGRAELAAAYAESQCSPPPPERAPTPAAAASAGRPRLSHSADWTQRATQQRLQQLSGRNDEVMRLWQEGTEQQRRQWALADTRAEQLQAEQRARAEEEDRARRERSRAAQADMRAVLDEQMRARATQRNEERRNLQRERRLQDERQRALLMRDAERRRRTRAGMASHRAFLDLQMQLRFDREVLPLETSVARPLAAPRPPSTCPAQSEAPSFAFDDQSDNPDASGS
eukprot:TRINITY_DN20026_c1_g1_i3.p1 TRINITY_DN20026_c1_g1~~TRINITY_DN20026_c1_g1_i3.p1  ORF type:complete len:660 (+),score=224.79 TRINITY_DN20026_c1_g1_i3:71-1981(+)